MMESSCATSPYETCQNLYFDLCSQIFGNTKAVATENKKVINKYNSGSYTSKVATAIF